MPDPKQLTFLENRAAEKSEVQAVQLASARKALDAATKQLAQLQQYESGYTNQLGERLGASMTIDALRGHQRFLLNVASAVRQQELEVAKRRAYVLAIERVWQETERRRQGFRVLATKVTDAARLVETRRQQKSNDEFAARAMYRTNIGL
jgi:flagellar FliJ protein